MSSTAWHIVQLVKKLPIQEQQAVRDLLTQTKATTTFTPSNPSAWEAEEGLPNDDPFFKIMEEVERERHTHQPRPVSDFE